MVHCGSVFTKMLVLFKVLWSDTSSLSPNKIPISFLFLEYRYKIAFSVFQLNTNTYQQKEFQRRGKTEIIIPASAQSLTCRIHTQPRKTKFYSLLCCGICGTHFDGFTNFPPLIPEKQIKYDCAQNVFKRLYVAAAFSKIVSEIWKQFGRTFT